MKIITQIITACKPVSKKEAENMVYEFKSIKNEFDGRIIEFPKNTIGKIYRHRGYDISKIIRYIPILYKTSVFGWSEPEIKREGHKTHPNINKYFHYINKFSDGNDEYFIRLTVTEEKAKQGKTGAFKLHSTAISKTSLYKNGDGLQRIRVITPGEASSSPFLDSRLAHFFNSVKLLIS